MISLNTLVFPNTDIFKDNFYPLFLFCSPLHFLLPVEPGDDETEDNELDSFMEQGLCQAHTPILMGESRDRFLHLLKDIENRKDDYAAQLSSLTMASLSQSTSRNSDEKRYEIVSSLMSGQAAPSSIKSDKDDTELWQARLVLTIAELLDREEAELQQHLQLLDDRELDMLRTLQGETESDEEDPFAQLEEIREHMLRARPGEMKKRFTAWLQLMSRKPLPDHVLWLATSQDSADQVINEYEKQNDGIAIPILKLLLPSRISISTPHLLDQINRFHQATTDIHSAIKADLDKLTTMEDYTPTNQDTLLPNGTDWGDKWQTVLEDFFPKNAHGRTKLTLYLLPNTTIADLFALDQEEKKPKIKHGLLGILNDS